jgi:hypothetical protein
VTQQPPLRFPVRIGTYISGIARTQYLTPMSVYRDEQPQDAYSRVVEALRMKHKKVEGGDE